MNLQPFLCVFHFATFYEITILKKRGISNKNMAITSFKFFVFCGIAIGAYYIMPQKFRWFILLLFSLAFYFTNAPAYTMIYILISLGTVYLATYLFDRIGNTETAQGQRNRRILFWTACVINVLIITVLKYLNFCILNINAIGQLFNSDFRIYGPTLVASLGISYYGFQLIGYLCDTYWGIVKPQKNILKLFLFTAYFPQMISGPISRYREVEEDLYAGKTASYEDLIFGLERVLWGLFKKLVVAGRLGTFVDVIYASPHDYSAFYIWIAAFAFALQLYADFSGCMDIVLGISECFGIRLSENFDSPFFSQTIQEFWQKWHISLGAWFKVYVMYPFQNTDMMVSLERKLKNKLGKKKGKRYTSYVAMLLVWLGIGVWHGSGWKYILGEGIWFWLIIVLGKEMKPIFEKISVALKINQECFSWRLFRSLRTFVLFSVGLIFFRVSTLREAVRLISLSITEDKITAFTSIVGIGLDAKGWFICVIGLSAMLVVDYLHTKGNVRVMLANQNILFRWFILLLLLFAVILWGQYGPGYDASDFIYKGF